MRVTLAIARRELAAYFSTPLAYVFLVAFVAAAGAATFYFGAFMDRRQADLIPFFYYHPWLYLILKVEAVLRTSRRAVHTVACRQRSGQTLCVKRLELYSDRIARPHPS